jgi:hypothetical protein
MQIVGEISVHRVHDRRIFNAAATFLWNELRLAQTPA